MAENSTKLNELLNAHSKAVKKYLNSKEDFKEIEEKYDKETHE